MPRPSEPRPSGGCRGFTLIEALIALAIAALLTAAITRLVATTRVSAASVGELTEMSALAETLMARLSATHSLQAGRSDGRQGALAWRIDIAPVLLTARALRISEKKTADAGDAKQAAGSGVTPAAFGGGSAARAPPPPPAWATYRVAVVIQARSGRTYAVDTIRIAPKAVAADR